MTTMLSDNRYESHITVTAKDAITLSLLQKFCRKQSLKCLIIELAQGEHPYQPMTSGFHQGTEEQVKTEVFALASALTAQGLEVQRLKIEADIRNSNLPTQELKDDKQYYESHFRIILPSEERLRELQELCGQHKMHVSRNASSKKLTRFVTLRVYRSGLEAAQQHAADMATLLQEFKFEITKQIHEFVVYDSRLELDHGW